VEERLKAIWSRTLQLSDIADDGDFFELGGDSLMAVGLFLEIEREFGIKLPITAIYDAPTVAAQAGLIAQERAPGFSHLVLLKEGCERAPLFIVHGVGGTVIELDRLGRGIESERAVYAIQARGLDGHEKPLESIEAIAALYVDAIRCKQAEGPYFIGGYSFGGLVALEMARLLGKENVAELLMIDAFAHPHTWPLETRVMVRARKLARRLRHMTPREFASALKKKLFGPKTDRATKVNNWLGEVNPNLPLPLRQARIAGDAALIAYRPRPYTGRATFIRAGKTGAVFPPSARNVWRRLIADLDIQTTKGDHGSILKEHAGELAKRVSLCLSQTQLSSPASVARNARSARECVASAYAHPGGSHRMLPTFGARLFRPFLTQSPGSPSLASAPSAPMLAGDDRSGL
jgi:thioesterase domain-containing protein/acyl carrier protein